MAAPTASMRLPLAFATVWLITATLSMLAAPIIIATVPYWHEVRMYLAQLGLWQTWVSIAACVGLLVISKRKHAENQEGWAQGAILIFVLGGLLTAVLLNYGVLPVWLLHASSLFKMAQVLALALLHWACAVGTWRSLYRYRANAAASM